MTAELAHESWTVDDLQTLPDDGHRYEIIDGGLTVTPPPTNRHQDIASRLLVAWWPQVPAGYRATHAAGVRLPANAATREQFLIPDVLLVRADATGDHFEPTDVLVAAEVVSPGSRVRDRHTKRGLYADLGIGEYWLLDPEQGTVTVHSDPSPAEGYRSVRRWSGAEPLEGLPGLTAAALLA
ncbi:Uma2 family endonuclease [Kineococcus sp. NUM-3379]